MAFGLINRLFRDDDVRTARMFGPIVEQINALESEIRVFSDQELVGQTEKFRQRLAAGEHLNDLMVEAFATVREAVRRHTDERQFDVQLMGGAVLHGGDVAEMRTGEGKTSVAILAAYLNALSGHGVHIITVNDYLAYRDANWYGRALVDRLGLSVGTIQHGMEADERRSAYMCDVTYGTNNEFGFDYLRDNMVHTLHDRVQRGLHYAIVDEVDSILIDEARTPLIISGPAEQSTDHYYRMAQIVRELQEGKDYSIDLKMRTVSLSESGIAKLEHRLNVENLYDDDSFQLVHYVEQALRAYVTHERGRDYVLFRDGRVVEGRDRSAEVVIVDEFTGRLMHGRRYSEGLHQAIEAKEEVEVQRESQTLATVTFQNYFRMYDKLAGMTGTAKTEAEELRSIYDVDVTVVPTNLPMVRDDRPDLVYSTANARDAAVIESIQDVHETGQPILVGTTSIERSEALSRLISRAGVPHNVLNAKYHEQEATIVAEAGREGSVTIATNMAGRGTDIILGGKVGERNSVEWQAEHDRVVALGGLYVIGTERHDARRIDNQLRGRSGRQGDPGLSQFYVSLEDDLMRRFSSERIKGVMERLGVEEHVPIESKMVSRALESAQTKVEAHNYEIRKYVLEFDNVVNQQRTVIYDQRERILKADDLDVLFREMLGQEIERLVVTHGIGRQSDETEFRDLVVAYEGSFDLAGAQPLRIEEFDELNSDDVVDVLTIDAETRYEHRLAEVPSDLVPRVLRWLMLQTADYHWVQHLTAIEDVRQGIGLRAYGQQDPLVAFKREGFHMFGELVASIRSDIVRRFFRIQHRDDFPDETVLTRHQSGVENQQKHSRPALAHGPSEKNGDGTVKHVSRRERRAQERAEKIRAKRDARVRNNVN